MVVEVKNGICYQLTGTMPCYLTTAFYPEHLMPTTISNVKFNIIRSCSSTQCVYTGMLHQNDGVNGSLVVFKFLTGLLLQRFLVAPDCLVVNKLP
jgi:hypothetical protein